MRIHPDLLRRTPDWSLVVGDIEGYNPFWLFGLQGKDGLYVFGERNNVWVCLEPSRLGQITQQNQSPRIDFYCWLIYETEYELYGGPVYRGWRVFRLHPNTRIISDESSDFVWVPIIERFPSRLWLNDPDPFLIPLGEDIEDLTRDPVVTFLLDNGWAWFVLAPNRRAPEPEASRTKAMLALRKIEGVSIVKDACGHYLWRGPSDLYVMFTPSMDECGPYNPEVVSPTEFVPLQPPIEQIFGGMP